MLNGIFKLLVSFIFSSWKLRCRAVD